MGGAIDRSIFADYQGKRIYFCCPGCDKKFKVDPERYLRTLRSKGIVLESSPRTRGTQTHCPIMTNNKLRKDLFDRLSAAGLSRSHRFRASPTAAPYAELYRVPTG